MIQVEPGTLVVYSDIGCPWSHVAVHRLRAARARAGLEDRLQFDMRSFPLELFNRRATPKFVYDAEVPVAANMEPEAGWQRWEREWHDYPVTMLPALEAVQAAKEQGLEPSARLDRALRVAFFGESRNIALFHELVEVASTCEGVDAGALEKNLVEGTHRHLVHAQKEEAEKGEVQGSPHVFLSDGSNVHNPGVKISWVGQPGIKFPVLHEDEPSIYDDIIRRAVRDEEV